MSTMRIMRIEGWLDHEPDEVWAVISNFVRLDAWHPALLACSADGEGVGAIRTLTVRAGTVRERLLERDPDRRVLRYEIVSGGSLSVRHAVLTMIVAASSGSGSTLIWELDGEPDGPPVGELSAQAEARYLGRIDDLRRHLDGR